MYQQTTTTEISPLSNSEHETQEMQPSSTTTDSFDNKALL